MLIAANIFRIWINKGHKNDYDDKLNAFYIYHLLFVLLFQHEPGIQKSTP